LKSEGKEKITENITHHSDYAESTSTFQMVPMKKTTAVSSKPDEAAVSNKPDEAIIKL
jgi:hypothetical protein